MHQQILPAFKLLKNPIDALNNRKDSFFTPNQPQFWLRNRINGPRTAGVSSIGIDGSVYHAVLQGFEQDEVLSENAQKATKISRYLPTGELNDAIFIVGGVSPCDLRERVAKPEYMCIIDEFTSDAIVEKMKTMLFLYGQLKNDNYAGNALNELTWEAYGKRYAEFLYRITNR